MKDCCRICFLEIESAHNMAPSPHPGPPSMAPAAACAPDGNTHTTMIAMTRRECFIRPPYAHHHLVIRFLRTGPPMIKATDLPSPQSNQRQTARERSSEEKTLLRLTARRARRSLDGWRARPSAFLRFLRDAQKMQSYRPVKYGLGGATGDHG